MEIQTEFKDRLKMARKNANMTQTQLAEAVGTSQGSISDLESGRNKTTGLKIKIAEVLGVDPVWLEHGDEKPTALQMVTKMAESLPSGITYDQIEPGRKQKFIPLYNVHFCCGNGVCQPEFESLKKTLPFDEGFFKRRNLNSDSFKLIYAKGDSMAPYINERDAVGIDINDKTINDGQVYALFLDGDLMIKRVFREGGGVLRLSSDNQAYRDKVIDGSIADGLIVIGRVVYRSG